MCQSHQDIIDADFVSRLIFPQMFPQITHNNQIIRAQLRNGRLLSSKGYALDVSRSLSCQGNVPSDL